MEEGLESPWILFFHDHRDHDMRIFCMMSETFNMMRLYLIVIGLEKVPEISWEVIQNSWYFSLKTVVTL